MSEHHQTQVLPMNTSNALTIDDLTVNFAHLVADALLSDWQWLVGKHERPLLISATGDVFSQNTRTGKVSFLDSSRGTATKVADTGETFRGALRDRDFVDSHFQVQLIGKARQAGLNLQPKQLYSYVHPPLLGGAYNLQNLEVTDIDVHLSVFGQLASNVRHLAEGASVAAIELAPPAKRRWWQAWR
jgi:hypothetical protein